jgi:DNA-binding NtrC family response regulator
MSHKILIVDDDADFNALLTDVFCQADYEVRSAHTPKDVIELLKKEPVDLIVTDQRMPGISGTEFIKGLKNSGFSIPVVMVSAFLDNHTIRELIRDGVGGVFMKPLNIFSLLKKTAELIEKSKESDSKSSEADLSNGAQNQLPFPFSTFSGRTPKTLDFAQKLYQQRDFGGHLLLIGAEGSDFRSICKDLVSMASVPEQEKLIVLTPDQMEPHTLREALFSAMQTAIHRVTLAIPFVDRLPAEARQLLQPLSRRIEPFNEISIEIRLIFLLREDPDTLYEKTLIDDDLYIYLGTNELRVPHLTSCLDELRFLISRVLNESGGSSGFYRLSDEALNFLQNVGWPGDFGQLRKVIQDASLEVSNQVLDLESVKNAYEGKTVSRQLLNDEGIFSYLQRLRQEYELGIQYIVGADQNKIQSVLGLVNSGMESNK